MTRHCANVVLILHSEVDEACLVQRLAGGILQSTIRLDLESLVTHFSNSRFVDTVDKISVVTRNI